MTRRTQTVNVIGEHGALLTLALPLTEAYANQVANGKLVPADVESARALAQPDAYVREPDRAVPQKYIDNPDAAQPGRAR